MELEAPEGLDVTTLEEGIRIAALTAKEPVSVESGDETATDTPFRTGSALKLKIVPGKVTGSHQRGVVVGQDGDTLEVVDVDGEVEDLEHTGDGTVQVTSDGGTPDPTATPDPDATSTPEPEAVVTATPEPTETPEPDATTTPEPEPTTTPEPTGHEEEPDGVRGRGDRGGNRCHSPHRVLRPRGQGDDSQHPACGQDCRAAGAAGGKDCGAW